MKQKRDIPAGWKYLKLKKLLTQDIKNGYSPNCPGNSGIKTSQNQRLKISHPL